MNINQILQTSLSRVKTYIDNKHTAASNNIGNLNSLTTSNKSNIVAAVNEIYQAGADAKSGLVDTLVAQGVKKASYSDSWETLYGYIDKYFTCNYVNVDIAANTWGNSTTMPRGIAGASSAVIGKKIYITGGYNGGNLNTVYIYDTETHTFSQGPSLNTARSKHRTVAVGNYLYVINGDEMSSGAANLVEYWDTVNGTSWQKAKGTGMYGDSCYAATSTTDGKLVAYGFYDGDDVIMTLDSPTATKWTTITPYFGSSYSTNNDFRFIHDYNGTLYVLHKDHMYSYNLSDRSIGYPGDTPTEFHPSYGATTMYDSVKNRFIVFDTVNRKTYTYNLSNNTWTTVSGVIPDKRYLGTAQCVDGICYLFGGCSSLSSYGDITGTIYNQVKFIRLS